MSAIRKRRTLAINEVIENILTGSPFETSVGINNVQIAMAADTDDITAQVTFGGRLIAEGLAIPQAAAAGRGPIVPEDMVINEPAADQERMVIRIVGGAAASAVRVYVNLTPV